MSINASERPGGLDSRLLHQLPLHFAGAFEGPTGSDEPTLRFRLQWIVGACSWNGGGDHEVFAILEGEVDMHYGESQQARSLRLRAGDVFSFAGGHDFVAVPHGRARVLMVEAHRQRPGRHG